MPSTATARSTIPSSSPTGLTLGSNNDNGTFSGVIQNTGGALSLTKTGTGVQALTGNNTFSGALTVSQGTLAVTKLSDPTTAAGTITLGGGGPATLQFIGSNDGTNRPINLLGNATLDASETSTPAADFYLNGTITGNNYNLTLTGTSTRGEIDAPDESRQRFADQDWTGPVGPGRGQHHGRTTIKRARSRSQLPPTWAAAARLTFSGRRRHTGDLSNGSPPSVPTAAFC